MPDSLINWCTGSRHSTRRTRAADQVLCRTPPHTLSVNYLIFTHMPFFSLRVCFKNDSALSLCDFMTITVATESPKLSG